MHLHTILIFHVLALLPPSLHRQVAQWLCWSHVRHVSSGQKPLAPLATERSTRTRPTSDCDLGRGGQCWSHQWQTPPAMPGLWMMLNSSWFRFDQTTTVIRLQSHICSHSCQLPPCPLCPVQQWSIMHFFTTQVTGLPNIFMSRCFWYQASLRLPPCRPKCWQLLPNPGLHMRWSSDCMFAHQVWDLLPSNCWENHLGPLLGKDWDLMKVEGPATFILSDFHISGAGGIPFLFDWVPGGWNGRYRSNPVFGRHLLFPFLYIHPKSKWFASTLKTNKEFLKDPE